jgi:hypothetical protein
MHVSAEKKLEFATYWCVFTIAVRLILPESMALFSTGATSSGLAGSMITASLDLSSTTRYA